MLATLGIRSDPGGDSDGARQGVGKAIKFEIAVFPARQYMLEGSTGGGRALFYVVAPMLSYEWIQRVVSKVFVHVLEEDMCTY